MNDSRPPKCRRCGADWLVERIEVLRTPSRGRSRGANHDEKHVELATYSKWLARVPDADREAFLLYLDHGRAETARRLGIKESAVRAAVKRTRNLLSALILMADLETSRV
jgi:DNA-directed RNA polymerase specialized sigma24 family protein